MPKNYHEAIQKTVDSTRGFALRLQDSNQRFAWVGLAFRDRNDAFDFNVSFSDFEKKLDLENNPEKYANEFKSDKNFSLNSGEKVKLDFGFGNSKPKESKKYQNTFIFFIFIFFYN